MNVTKETAYQKISELVTRFGEQYASYKDAGYNETLTRRDFIDPFFKALGWDVDNENGYAESYREVIHEDRVRIGKATKAPDYSFRLAGGKRLFFVEAKKPSVAVKEEILPAYQVRRYGWSAKLPISIITDFEEFAIYDCTKKPYPDDKASVARIKYLTYTDYLPQFDFVWDTFSKERVLKGSFDKFIAGNTSKRGTTAVDYDFLQSLDNWRTELATSISRSNKNLDEDEINFVVQQTLDRIIFLRIAEDRSVEPYGNLKSAIVPLPKYKTEEGKTAYFYQNLLSIFRVAEDKYNSGLFDFDRDKVSKDVVIDNKVISTIINQLYYPESPYEFSVLSVEILGSAYEQFLGKTITIDKAHRAKIEEKPAVRKAGGVYYTPQYIVDYIVENTLGKLAPLTTAHGYKKTTPGAVAKLSIVDPACGSGSFLIGAYQYLLTWHIDYYTAHPQDAIRDKAFTPTGALSTSIKKQILLNNIYGVDIDVNAVEVTKLSLLLKCMEGETEASINSQMRLFNERVLPSLDNNIKSGNSLVDTDYYDTQLDFGEEKKIKPFNWQRGFPQVYKQGSGFDVVIGNPPYVRMQTIDKTQTDYFKQNYKSAAYGNYDLYVLFTEMALKRMTAKGLSGMILPHKFFQAEYGNGIRKVIEDGNHLLQINDFSTNQVFENATTYTCLLFLSKEPNKKFSYQKIELGNELPTALQSIRSKQILSQKLKQKWLFNSGAKESVFKRLSQNKVSLKDISRKIFKGSSTGNDDVYLLKFISKKGKISTVYSTALNENVEIESKLLKPFIYGSSVRKFHVEDTGLYLLFPYEINDNATVIDFVKLQSQYPLAARYFERVKHILAKRKLSFTKSDFHKFSAGRSLAEYLQPKILIPDMLVESRLGIDSFGEMFHGPAIHSLVLKDEYAYLHLHYVSAILSSTLFWFFVSNTSTALRGNAYRLTPDYINQFPMKIIDLKNKTDVKTQKQIIKLVDILLTINEEKQSIRLQTKLEQLNTRIAHCEDKINQLVYGLYNLSPEEIKVVTG